MKTFCIWQIAFVVCKYGSAQVAKIEKLQLIDTFDSSKVMEAAIAGSKKSYCNCQGYKFLLKRENASGLARTETSLLDKLIKLPFSKDIDQPTVSSVKFNKNIRHMFSTKDFSDANGGQSPVYLP